MTKLELLEHLLPFTDDLEIEVKLLGANVPAKVVEYYVNTHGCGSVVLTAGTPSDTEER